LLLAGLQAVGTTKLTGMVNGYDHLERMLKLMSVNLRRRGDTLSLKGEQNIHPRRIKVPGDVSAAAPFILLAILLEGSDLKISQMGSNPNRMGMIKILTRSGAQIKRERNWQFGAEPVCQLRVKYSDQLEAFSIAPNMAPFLPDELPLLALLATQIPGTSRLHAGDRAFQQVPDILQLTAQILRQFGADIETSANELAVHGPKQLTGAEVQCAGDRRLALLAVTAALLAETPSQLHGAEVVEDTYPGLLSALKAT
jgi:3-phosphoshikimate 1-carboxyvinyltransferase